MGLLYKVSDKQLLQDRNKLFKEVGLSVLESNGFKKRPFKTSWFGEYYSGIQGYIYTFGRISENGYFEYINIYITKGDEYIKVFLNIFNLSPKLLSINELNEYEGINFGIHPSTKTNMRLRSDDYKGPPLFYMLFLPEHKVGNYYTKLGYEAEINKLKKLIKSDLENIDSFVKRWHELHKPNLTDWEGNLLGSASL